MPKLLKNAPHIRAGLDHLITNDKVFATHLTPDDVVAEHRPFGLPMLVRIVLGQQISVAAAATLWRRLQDAVDVDDPRAFLSRTPEQFRELGISPQKQKYILALADAVHNDRFDFKKLSKASDDDVIAALTSIKGFGVWSAQMVLIFQLARPDVWPSGDLGVQDGLKYYKKLKERPDAKQTEKLGAKFAPHRSSGALLLWRLNHKMKEAEKAEKTANNSDPLNVKAKNKTRSTLTPHSRK